MAEADKSGGRRDQPCANGSLMLRADKRISRGRRGHAQVGQKAGGCSMQRGLGACLLFAFAAIPMQPAGAAGLPEIKVSATNRVPACATPGRMLDYLKSRNPEIDARYA